MKRRMVALVMAFALVLSLCACGVENSAKTESKTLLEHGLDVIATMEEMAGSEEYVNFYTGSKEMAEIINEIGAGDYSAPAAVYKLTIDETAIEEWTMLSGAEGLSDNLKAAVTQKAVGAALITQINAQSGATTLAATSICTAGKTFVSTEASGTMVYIFAYENGCPAAVSFVEGEDHAVAATGNFILNDGFDTSSEDTIRAFFEVTGVKVESIPLD